MSSRSQNKRQEEGSPVLRKQSESASRSKLNSVQMSEREQEAQEPDAESPDAQESQQPDNQSCCLEYVYYSCGMIHR